MVNNNDNGVWKRPLSVPYPSVWCRFDGLREIDGAIPKFWIQDVPEEDFGKFADLMISHFIRDEPISSSTKIMEEEESKKVMRQMWLECYQQKMGLACYMENPKDKSKPILAGLNATYVMSKNQKPKSELKGEGAYSIMYVVDYVLCQIKDAHEELKMDHLLNALGLYVFPEFRGQALGQKILDAREPLSKAVGIPASVTVFTSPFAQKSAEKSGYQFLAEAKYVDLIKMNPRLRFYDIEKKTKSAKLMYKIF